MKVLLDTCALIWLVSRDTRLSQAARQGIESADFVYISPVSAWEIGINNTRGRLHLPETLSSWWKRVLETHDLSEFPLFGEAAIRSTNLPPLHQDPADRLLIAVALEHQFTLITPDEKIIQYPHLKTLW